MAKSGAKPSKGKGKAPSAPGRSSATKRAAPSTHGGPPKKRLRKGEVRTFVDLPEGLARKDGENEGSSSEGEAEEDEGEDLGEGAEAFLAGLDIKQMARTRVSLKKEHRLAKPQQDRPKSSSIPILATASKSKKGEDGEEGEGELIADLSEDDFAFGSGGSDDDLSIMSDASLDGTMSDMSSDLDSDLDDEDFDSELGQEEEEAQASWTGFAAEESESENESDLERAYENKKRRRIDEAPKAKNGLMPIRLPDGTLAPHPREPAPPAEPAKSKNRVTFEESDDDEPVTPPPVERDEAVARAYAKGAARSDPLGPRFGRPAVKDVLEIKDTATRLAKAREEIATLSRDIIASPELGLNLLRRLVSFCPTRFTTGKKDEDGPALVIDQPVRALALLSTLAVFLDIIPGYRIRPISETEKETKVSQAVLRQREWEDGLVNSYRRFLEICEKEVQQKTPLSAVALKCLCNLLEEKTHFNYTVNIMDAIARQLAQQKWDETQQMCLDAVAAVFRKDQTGADSLHLVQLLTKTIRAANFRVDPSLLAVFLHLRLRDELAGRASHHGADRPERGGRTSLPKGVRQTKKEAEKKPHVSKKARKAMKLKAEVRKELAEAEIEVGQEDKRKAQTETLKLVFALYFRVIKLESRSPLLPTTLEGLARFAHLVNVDFFRDLLENLKRLMRLQSASSSLLEQQEEQNEAIVVSLRERLLCIVTAFELLSGQGEALNIDLADFVADLYNILLSLAVSPRLEDAPHSGFTSHPSHPAAERNGRKPAALASEADLLFRALHHALLSRSRGLGPQRACAFGKRLLTCALSWPAASATRALDVVGRLVVREPTLEAVLGRDDDDEEGGMPDDEGSGAVWWEIGVLKRQHYDDGVRLAAARLLQVKS